MEKSKNIATDSFFLIFIRCITMGVGIIQAMILARTLTKEAYGTYSQALLIISFFAPFLSLGLENAINYFFNRTEDTQIRSNYINTIFMLSLILGITGGLILIGSKTITAQYFSNIQIVPIIAYIAFRPCLGNLIALYQPLFISSGFAKMIAIRNLIVSLIQIVIIGICSYFTQNLVIIFLLLLVLDVVQLVFFAGYFHTKSIVINPFNFEKTMIKPILKYALPMMLAISVGTISLNLDKLLISNLMTVEDYALYSNMAKELPFSFVATSFTAVVSPQIIKLINFNRMDEFRELWADYIEIGYTVTWTLCGGAILLAPQLIEILYTEKYISSSGIIVFLIYIIVAMIRFTYFGLVPTALGETKIVLYYSIMSLCINFILNYLFFYLFGMIGPPLATLISLSVMAFFYFRRSLRLTESTFCGIFRIKKLMLFISNLLIVGFITNYIVVFIKSMTPNVLIQFIVGYLVFIFAIFLLKHKDIIKVIHRMNNQKEVV